MTKKNIVPEDEIYGFMYTSDSCAIFIYWDKLDSVTETS